MEKIIGKNCRLHQFLLAVLSVVAVASLAGLLYVSSAGLSASRALRASGVNPDPAHISISGSTITVTPVGEEYRSADHPWADRINDPDIGVPGGNAATKCTPDVRNIQWAADYARDNAGVDTVILAAGAVDYQFGNGWYSRPNPTALPVYPFYLTDNGDPAHADFVGFDGDMTIMGQGMPKIVGGFDTFRTYAEVDLTIQGIHFDKSVGSAIAVPAANNVLIKGNKITNTIAEATIPLGRVSWPINIGESLWMGDLVERVYPGAPNVADAIQMWMFWLGEPDILIAGGWPFGGGALPAVGSYARLPYPQMPGQPLNTAANAQVRGLSNFLFTPFISMKVVPALDDLNLAKGSADLFVRNVTVEDNEIDIHGDNPNNDPLLVPGNPSTYIDRVSHDTGISVWELYGDSNITIKGNTIRNAMTGVWANGFPNAKVTVDDNDIFLRNHPNMEHFDRMGIDLAHHFVGGPGEGVVTNNDIQVASDALGIWWGTDTLSSKGFAISNNTLTGNGIIGIETSEYVNAGEPVNQASKTISNNDLTDFTGYWSSISLGGFINNVAVTGNDIGSVSFEGGSGISVNGFGNSVQDNEFAQSGIMGLQSGDKVSVFLGEIRNLFDGFSLQGYAHDNYVKEQGNYVPDTGGATFQVVDYANMYCLEEYPSDPLCANFVPNRVVGHPANVFAQQEDVNPGIGDRVSSYQRSINNSWGASVMNASYPSQATVNQYRVDQ